MARSSHIYIAMRRGVIIGAWTVKREMLSDLPYRKGVKYLRAGDGYSDAEFTVYNITKEVREAAWSHENF